MARFVLKGNRRDIDPCLLWRIDSQLIRGSAGQLAGFQNSRPVAGLFQPAQHMAINSASVSCYSGTSLDTGSGKAAIHL